MVQQNQHDCGFHFLQKLAKTICSWSKAHFVEAHQRLTLHESLAQIYILE